MGIDLEERSTEDLGLEEEQEKIEGPGHFIGSRVCQIADQLPSYFGTKFISALTKKGIPIDSRYSALSPDQADFLSRLYEKYEEIIIQNQARIEQRDYSEQAEN